jgi:hypothetical protein
MAFVKLTYEDCIHNGYQYKEGLNCLNGEFNNEKICGSGGLYFCRKEDTGKWCNYGYKLMYYIWDVELCEDSKIVDMGDKLKTDKFILKNKRTIWDNEEICKLIVQYDGNFLNYVNQKVMTDEICKLAVQQNGYVLRLIKPKFMTDEICKLAVNQNGLALQFVKPELMTNEICKLAIKQNPDSKCYVKKTKNKLTKIISLSLIVGCIGLGILHYRKKLWLSK